MLLMQEMLLKQIKSIKSTWRFLKVRFETDLQQAQEHLKKYFFYLRGALDNLHFENGLGIKSIKLPLNAKAQTAVVRIEYAKQEIKEFERIISKLREDAKLEE